MLSGCLGAHAKAAKHGMLAEGGEMRCSCGLCVDSQGHRIWDCRWNQELREGEPCPKVVAHPPAKDDFNSMLIFTRKK